MIEGLAVIAVLVALGALALSWYMWRRFRAALGSGDAQQIEKQLRSHHTTNQEIGSALADLQHDASRLDQLGRLALQKISLVRFNPFGDVGGDQSFSLALLDAHDSGVILTSIHGRGGTRVYAKPIDYGKSKYSLSVEEKKALASAIKRTPQQLIKKGS